jgi:fibronectin-binding autotransporter adhesin
MLDQFSVRISTRTARLSVVALGTLFVGLVSIVPTVLEAASYSWSVQSGDWSTTANWGGTLPTASDSAYIVNGGTANVTAFSPTSGSLTLGSRAGSGNVQMTGGTLTVVDDETIGDTGMGSFFQSGGTNQITYFAGNMLLGNQAGGSGAYSLTGNGFLQTYGMFVGYSGTGTFTQSSGTNAIWGTGAAALALGYGGGNGTYNFYGGMLMMPRMIAGAGQGVFNFSGGTLVCTKTDIVSIDYNTVPITLGTSGGGATIDTGRNNVVFSAPFSGPGSLTITDAGTINLTAANTFTGNTLIGSGTLALGSPLALQYSTLDTSGSGALNFESLNAATLGGLTGPGTLGLANSSALALVLSVGNNNSSTTFSGILQGGGSLNKTGNGVLALSGSSTYSGPTTIKQGDLVVNGSLASPVTVSSGGILGGTGRLTSVTVSASGQIAPGAPLGVLSVTGSLILVPGAALNFELDRPATSSMINSGTLILGNQQFTDFNFTWTPNFAPGNYDLINFASSSGTLGTNTGTIDGYPATLTLQSNELVLNVVPEPSSITLLAISALGLLRYGWWRSERKNG